MILVAGSAGAIVTSGRFPAKPPMAYAMGVSKGRSALHERTWKWKLTKPAFRAVKSK